MRLLFQERSELKQVSRMIPDERSYIGIRKAASHFIDQAKRTETGIPSLRVINQQNTIGMESFRSQINNQDLTMATKSSQ